MSLPDAAQAAVEQFHQAGGWEQRARLLMQWAERLPPMAQADKVEANRVAGCESTVWLMAQPVGERLHFTAASEARLIRGLLALLLIRIDGLSPGELDQLDLPAWFEQLGLGRQLSPSRSNGLNAVLKRMRQLAAP